MSQSKNKTIKDASVKVTPTHTILFALFMFIKVLCFSRALLFQVKILPWACQQWKRWFLCVFLTCQWWQIQWLLMIHSCLLSTLLFRSTPSDHPYQLLLLMLHLRLNRYLVRLIRNILSYHLEKWFIDFVKYCAYQNNVYIIFIVFLIFLNFFILAVV